MKFLNTYKLRQKPRLGAKQSTGKLEWEELSNEIMKLTQGASAAGKAYGETIGKILDDNARLSAGLGVIAGNYEKVNAEGLKLVKTLTFLEEHNKDLNDIFKVGSVVAGEFAENYRRVGEEIGFSDKTINKYVKSVAGIVGTTLLATSKQNRYTEAMIQGQAIMQESMGLSADQAEGFEQYSNSLGTYSTVMMQAIQGMATDMATQLGDASKAGAIQAEIMGEIGSLSEETQLQYGRMPGNLETAVLKAKALGMTMENLKQTGEKLLDIESSVGDELEYQLLSGQRLVKNGKSLTNAYRMAFMEGNGKKQAEIMNDILKDQGDTLRNNYMARKKMSDLLGIDEKTLTRSLNKQKIAAELGQEALLNLEGQDLTDKIKELEANFKGDENQKKAYLEKLKEFKSQTDTRTSHEKNMEKGQLLIANLIAKNNNVDIAAAAKAADEGFDSLQGVRDFYGKPGDMDKTQKLLGYGAATQNTIDAYSVPGNDLQAIMGKIPGLDKIGVTLNEAIKKSLAAASIVYAVSPPNNNVSSNNTSNSNSLGPVISTIAPADMTNFSNIVANTIKTMLTGITIKADTMFGSTGLNGPYRIGNS
jgi:hypothetical protein